VWRKRTFDLGEDRASAQDVLGDLINNERTAALYAAVRELPEQYRDAVVLCDLEEKSYEETARLMKCPVGTVRSRVHRARMLLAARLKPLLVSAGVTVKVTS
jgi:RNA polymerase sigma-70 factor (ECF subfamily)